MDADADAIVVGTSHLDLRPLAACDEADLARLFADEEAMRNQCRLATREEARAYIAEHEACYAQIGFGQLAIIERDSGDFVGKCGFSSHHVDGYREFLLSHVIDPAHEASDYDLEALAAMIDYAFNELDFMRVVSIAKPANRRIRKILETLGMESEKRVEWEGHTCCLYVIHNC